MSTRTAHKWLSRFYEFGPARLLDRTFKLWRTAAARELVLAEPRLLQEADKHLVLLAPASPGAIRKIG